ncbi:thrombin-like enzyme flavoxobin [Salvelinus fontinalis]|uniref:thrombin-like enzyme flavoxobin n=1 Tax=Salvelinus fontinalis TaxID=8038 RepID=UPI0024860767|nr:thrombin-like enzyme flavoxobin [Salvelinus fontinalis]
MFPPESAAVMRTMKILGGVLILSLMLAETTLGDIQKRVVGGNTCSPTERRYHVRLTARNPSAKLEKVCGSSLITNKWLLTAARCWPDGQGWKMYAEVGGHPGPVKPQVEIKQKTIHRDKKGKTHDIMLLQLPTPVPGAVPGPGVDPIPLGDCANMFSKLMGKTLKPKVFQTVQIAGYVATPPAAPEAGEPDAEEPAAGEPAAEAPDAANTKVLHCAELDVMKCDDVSVAKSHQDIFCAQRAGVETCSGDSGTGVVYKNQLYGVFITEDTGEECSAAALIMDVCKYKVWINKIIGK